MLSGQTKQKLVLLKENLKHYANFYNLLFGHKDYVKFIIIARSRTGSNLLVSYLNSHEAVQSYPEMFQLLNGRTTKTVWNRIYSRKARNIKSVGFKIFYHHPQDSEDKSIWELIKQDTSLRIIHLTRRHKLRAIVSQAIAEKTGTYSKRWYNLGTHKTEYKRLCLSPASVKSIFEQVQNWEEQTNASYIGHDMLRISYEDLIDRKEECISRVFRFIGVKPVETKTNMKKQNPEPLNELISNYEEIKNHFRNTEWISQFDD